LQILSYLIIPLHFALLLLKALLVKVWLLL
jgi:hypothetical protein